MKKIKKTVFMLEKPNRENWIQWRHAYVDKAYTFVFFGFFDKQPSC